jgi:hypothetical protein
MVRARVLTLGLLPLALTVGAAAQGAEGDKDMQRLLARPSRLLFKDELRGNCAGLTVTIKTHIDRLRELQTRAKKEREGPPVTVFDERPAAAGFARERNQVEALNVVLDAKGCNPVNIEQELKKTPPQTQGQGKGQEQAKDKDGAGRKSKFR